MSAFGGKADIAKLAVNIRLPPLPGIDRIHHLTNSSMMGVDFLPRHGRLLLTGGQLKRDYVGEWGIVH
jgi:hypothetical protein